MRWLFDPPDEMLRQYARADPKILRLKTTGRAAFPPPPGQWANDQRRAIQARIDALDSIRDKLEYCTPPEEAAQRRTKDGVPPVGNDVFVVHGHDNAAKEALARFIDNQGLHAIILHEQTNEGRTIIEKFEDYSDVGYTVVLLTADDVGAPVSEPEALRPRARQNVIFELGFFVGKLGRKRVCVLYKESIERPSDH